MPAPYQVHERGTDQYGYAAFEGNYYWVPGLSRQEVKILQYSDRLKIYLARECLAVGWRPGGKFAGIDHRGLGLQPPTTSLSRNQPAIEPLI